MPVARVNRSADCGNSPKNKIVEDIVIALETNGVEFLSTILDPDATWNYAGGTVATGEAILGKVGVLDSPTSLTIDRVMSHGKVGAANGNVARGKNVQRFCYVIEFTSVKCSQVFRIESYGG